ncbi:TetR/AcrR family transcriptional regulator [Phenylobacterium sp. LH3H17]|uniref:TetR/AcrR family transcriptional regulator n=1 Tax=Phenylobacterium sp. LH3H17 TaxID=2903901 RepID=UPI0020C9F969|nr:TetR/AcrR family transcriptional regulator [Phenylobacterium sp. LH3H17]UTP38678.1 TetR/AcrR family transcriptional regulator [Phenylobacterium sp. LH3H17]
MRKGDATKARILDETARQAAVKGFGAVSLNDVAGAVGLSKSGLFKHFESKEVMELATLDQGFDRFVAFVWTPAEPLPPGRPRVEMVFDRWLDWTEVENAAGGCLIMAASVELDDQPGPLRDLLTRRIKQWRKALTREVKALRDPELSDEEAAIVVFQMKSYVLGHADAKRLMGDSTARKVAHAAFTALLDRTVAG